VLKSFILLFVNVSIVLFLSTTVERTDSENRQLWFDKELRNLEKIRTKSHKYMKEMGKIYIRPLTELQQCEYDADSQIFRDLRSAFKGLHRFKYAQYLEKVEADLKSNLRCFFKFANLPRNSSDYPSAMFLGDTCTRSAQVIADLFGQYFQDVYVRDRDRRRILLWTTVLRILPLFR
jgi:hypothetical protein